MTPKPEKAETPTPTPTPTPTSAAEWCDEEIKLLVKGARIIAAGTRERWDVIAHFIEEHSKGRFKRTGKEVLAKTKEMQNPDNKVREDVNKKAFEKALQNKKEDLVVQDAPSERYISPAEQFLAEQGSNLAVWSPDEQKVLEQALKTYPASLTDRWDKIAECLPSRSKKDCMVRYKELVEIIQAKKEGYTKSSKIIFLFLIGFIFLFFHIYQFVFNLNE